MRKVQNRIVAGSALAFVAALFIGHWESSGRSHLTAYQDQGGVWTICDGITADVKPGMKVTQSWCDLRKMEEIERHSTPLDRVSYQMRDVGRVAWADFCYNVGTGNCSGSSAFKQLVSGQEMTSCDGFLAWRWATVKGVKRDCSLTASKCAGIWKRRNAERNLCQGRITIEQFLRSVGYNADGGELYAQ